MKHNNLILTLLLSLSATCVVGQESNTIEDATFGRRLFVDQTWIEDTNLDIVQYQPTYLDINPIVKADNKWELNVNGDPYAAPFSGGVWYDELDEKFKMWYSAGGEKVHGLITCYAESNDGKVWTKPLFDIVENTNIVDQTEHDCVSVMIDKSEIDPSKRYKMFVVKFNSPGSVSMQLKYSADGIHWGECVALSGELYDRCSVYKDPFRGTYVISLKTVERPSYGRTRSFIEHIDPEMAVSLSHRVFDRESDKFIKYWFKAEDDDPRHPEFAHIMPQIYNHEAIAYENRMLGYFSVWQGPENDACDSLNIQKRNEVLIGWSKDGFNWDRRNKKPFLPVSEDSKAWNAGNVQSTNGNPIIVGDSLYFYVSGRYETKPIHDSNFATGMATLRRDGFTSMKSESKDGYLLTPLMEVLNPYLFVNVDVHAGSLRVEVLDSNNNPIKGFTKSDFKSIKRLSSTKVEATWRKRQLAELQGMNIKLKFYLENGEIYSFWNSKWESGESGGYTSAGGPGLHPSGQDLPLN